tara:strand:- start:52 stop:942 length:891 start_codon:yes stop_codon:yes gene_type:complete
MAFRKLVGSYKDYNLSTHIIEDGYLAVDVDTGSLRIGDGVTPGGSEISGGGGSSITIQEEGSSLTTAATTINFVGDGVTASGTGATKTITISGGGGSSLGDLTAVGSTLSSPSNADLTLTSSGGNVVIEGIRVAGTTISTEDSSPGIEIAGNLIPSQDGVFQLGSTNRRWQTLYVAAETIDLGGATISSDGTGTVSIAASGAVLPTGSKLQENPISILGVTGKTAVRPVQNVKVFVSDGSTTFSDTELLAKDGDLNLEFNATVETIPVYTEAQQTFTLADGTNLSDQVTDVTLFQF